MKPFTVSELMEVCRQYYPAGRTLDDHEHGASPEWHRFHSRWHEAMADRSRWLTLRGALEDAFPGNVVGDATAYTHDGGYRCSVQAIEPGDKADGVSLEVVGCVSLLAPLYFVYGTQHRYRGGRRENPAAAFFLEALPETLTSSASKVARAIESVFGYQPLPVQWASVPVAGVCLDHFEPAEATLFRALFTLEPALLP
ncbi:hypothetical protein ATI61_1255 [Archangium gephyra]|uniref:Uncharacterized protein n=1 Tax=Archangium gephyra TaxID=48 RepID=A0AAC8QIY5_9BACT|nr:hypothetical protein [Archangium gephyra]AKJ08335.1 Hypothetical protein AA314_09961 [Archangium gephyra]REG15379.1 hypothetical protein ATI61_1255 [Archangium gephyra]